MIHKPTAPKIYTPQDGSRVLNLDARDVRGSKIYDRSGKGNHGAITGAVLKPSNYGIPILDFDGIDDKIIFADLGIFDGTVEFSIEACYKANRFALQQRLINFQGERNMLLTTGDNVAVDVITIRVEQDGWKNTVSTPTLIVGKLYHLIVTYNPTTGWVLYLNGKQEDSDNTIAAIASAISTNSIGADQDGSNPFKARINNINIFNRKLSSFEASKKFDKLRHRYGI